MAVRLSVDVWGDQQLERRLQRFSDRPRNLAGAYERLKEVFFGFEMRQFETEGASGSGGWAALKPATIRAKAAKGQPTDILQATTRLFESLTSDTSSDWAGHFTRNEMFYGTKDPITKYHQRGTRRMPRRRPVELTETQRKKFVKVFQGWLVEDDRSHYGAKELWATGRAT